MPPPLPGENCYQHFTKIILSLHDDIPRFVSHQQSCQDVGAKRQHGGGNPNRDTLIHESSSRFNLTRIPVDPAGFTCGINNSEDCVERIVQCEILDYAVNYRGSLPNVASRRTPQTALTAGFLCQTMDALQHTMASPSVTCFKT